MAHHIWRAAPSTPEEVALMKHSIWGDITASLDWCEENLLTMHLVEFWNSTSNAMFIFLGIYGLWRCYVMRMDVSVWLGYLGLLTVGCGSFMFHGTLTWNSQLLDELPMLWGDGFFLWALTPKAWKRTWAQKATIALILAGAIIAVSLVYVRTRHVIFFEASYGAGAVLIVIRCALWSHHNKDNSKTDMARSLIFNGTLIFLLGFLFWNLDNTFCMELRRLRKLVGFFFAPLFQFHALWHLLTGFATYCLAVFVPLVDQFDPESLSGGHVEERYELGLNWLGLPVTKLMGSSDSYSNNGASSSDQVDHLISLQLSHGHPQFLAQVQHKAQPIVLDAQVTYKNDPQLVEAFLRKQASDSDKQQRRLTIVFRERLGIQ